MDRCCEDERMPPQKCFIDGAWTVGAGEEIPFL